MALFVQKEEYMCEMLEHWRTLHLQLIRAEALLAEGARRIDASSEQ